MPKLRHDDSVQDLGHSVRRNLLIVTIPRQPRCHGMLYTGTRWEVEHTEEDNVPERVSLHSKEQLGLPQTPRQQQQVADNPEAHVEKLRDILKSQKVQMVRWSKVRCTQAGESIVDAEDYHRVEFMVDSGGNMLESILLLLRK
jgi:hypothetical protein